MAEIIAHLVASSARESRREEGPMAAEYSGTIPKRGDRVGIAQQEGVFEVVDINSLMQTANVKSTDGIAPKMYNRYGWSHAARQLASRPCS